MGKAILLTGEPRIGKTTTIKRVLDSLGDITCCGFYTREIRLDGEREGFDIVTLSGKIGIMARKSLRPETDLHISSYGVSLDFLENVVLPTTKNCLEESELVVIDEIGPMQVFSQEFRSFILHLLDSSKLIFGTIYIRPYEWLDDIKQLDNVELFRLTIENRDSIVEELKKLLKSHLEQPHT